VGRQGRNVAGIGEAASAGDVLNLSDAEPLTFKLVRLRSPSGPLRRVDMIAQGTTLTRPATPRTQPTSARRSAQAAAAE